MGEREQREQTCNPSKGWVLGFHKASSENDDFENRGHVSTPTYSLPEPRIAFSHSEGMLPVVVKLLHDFQRGKLMRN